MKKSQKQTAPIIGGGKKWELEERALKILGETGEKPEICLCGQELATTSIFAEGYSFGRPETVKCCAACKLAADIREMGEIEFIHTWQGSKSAYLSGRYGLKPTK